MEDFLSLVQGDWLNPPLFKEQHADEDVAGCGGGRAACNGDQGPLPLPRQFPDQPGFPDLARALFCRLPGAAAAGRL